MEISLGSRYRDKISGFVGVAIGKTSWINGCMTVGLKPPVDKDGKAVDAVWFDSPQLEFVEEVVGLGPQNTGGPKPSPQRSLQGN